jgi:hypothetical protein
MSNLCQTFEKLGIRNFSSLDVNVILHSDAVKEANEQLYRSVNQDFLLPMVEKEDPKECIHVTGEMRALSDRLHRLVCRKMVKKYNNRFKMVISLSSVEESYYKMNSFFGREIMRWVRKEWRGLNLNWFDYLDVFDLLSDEEVTLYRLRQPEKIHFSIFAGEYVLLQAEHPPGTHVKEVWLLKSELLYKQLLAKCKEIINKAELLHPRVFRDFMLSISGPSAANILFLLRENKKMMIKQLISELKSLELLEDAYNNLRAAGFIEEMENYCLLTEEGKEYANFLFEE